MYSPQRVYDPRAFDSFWRPIIKIFQVLCLSHRSIFSVGRLVYFIMFSIVGFLIKIYSLNSVYLHDKHLYKRSQLMCYTSIASIFCHTFVHVIIHLEPFFTKDSQVEIYRRFREIEETFAVKLNHITDFDAIRKRLAFSIFIYYSAFELWILASSIYYPPADTNLFLYAFTRFLMTSVNIARRCQIFIHIHYTTNILMNLKVLLVQQHQTYRINSDESTSYKRIQYLRDIYSNVWLIMKLFDRCFGWTLVTFLIEFTIDLINSSYQVYFNIKIYHSIHKTIRNYLMNSWWLRFGICFMGIHFISGTTFYQIMVILHFWFLWMVADQCESAVTYIFTFKRILSYFFENNNVLHLNKWIQLNTHREETYRQHCTTPQIFNIETQIISESYGYFRFN